MKLNRLVIAQAFVILSVVFFARSAFAQGGNVAPLMTKDLPAARANQEGAMMTVEYAPGASSAAHRHNANVFVYVLEGSVIMQVAGGKEMTLKAGDTFYESPNDVHTVSRNASSTAHAKIVVFMVKDKGAPATVPVR